MMDLSKSVNEAIQNIVESGMIEDTVAKSVESTIKQSINDQLRSYSNFGKKIEKAVEEALNFEPIDLPSYNDMIVKIVRQQVKDQLEQSLASQVATKIEDLLKPPPAELKLSQLVEMWIKQLRDKNDDGCVCHGESQAKVTMSQDNDYGSFYKVQLWESESDKSPDIWIGVHVTQSNDEESPRGHVYHLRLKTVDTDRLFVENLHGIERMLFQMKAAGKACSIILDDFDHVDLATESYHD